MTSRDLAKLPVLLLAAAAALALFLVPVTKLTGTAGGKPAAPDLVAKLLVALPLIFLVCKVFSVLAKRLGQPAVIGEIVAGVLLGPSFLGWLAPDVATWIFPAGLVSIINVMSQLGLVLFMFLVGYELDLELVRRRSKAAVLVSNVSVAVPFACGIGLAFLLYGALGGGLDRVAMTLFLAVSMSVTALPVLARIINDRGMAKQPVAALALSCAAVDDITAWCLLALVAAVANATSVAVAGMTVVLTLLFVAVMWFAVRPALRLLDPDARPAGKQLRPDAVLLIVLVGLLLSALATNSIGIHPIFGAFVFGALVPRGSIRFRAAAAQIEPLTVTLLLPLFFVYTGLHTRFGLLGANLKLWAWCALICVVAIAAKWGGSMLAARVVGIGWRESATVGALMNCRGLTELVVLNVGLDLKVISPTLFAMLVVMTLVSTVATAPALSLIERYRRVAAGPPVSRVGA